MEGTVEERVIKVFSEFKKIPIDQIKLDTTFDEMGLDSLDGLNLIFELEEEFDLMIPDDKVQSMRTVGQVVEGIEYLLANKDQASESAEAVASSQSKANE